MATTVLNFQAVPFGLVSDSAAGADAVANLATALADFDIAGAAIVAITGDSYSATTHQFAFGGATGLTHAQWATQGAKINTAINDVVTAKAAVASAGGGDLSVSVNTTAFRTKGQLVQALRDAADTLAQLLSIH